MGVKISQVQLDSNDQKTLEAAIQELIGIASDSLTEEIKNNSFLYLQNNTSKFIEKSNQFLQDNQRAINNFINNPNDQSNKFPDYFVFHHDCVLYQKQVWNFLGQILYTIIIKDENTAYIIDESQLQKTDIERILQDQGVHRGHRSIRYQTSNIYAEISKIQKIILPKNSWLSKTKSVIVNQQNGQSRQKWKLGRNYYGNAGQIDEFALALTIQNIMNENKKITSIQKMKISQSVDATAGRLIGDIVIPNSQVQFAVKSIRNSAASIASDTSIVQLAENIKDSLNNPKQLTESLKEILQKDIERGAKIKGISYLGKITTKVIDNSKNL